MTLWLGQKNRPGLKQTMNLSQNEKAPPEKLYRISLSAVFFQTLLSKTGIYHPFPILSTSLLSFCTISNFLFWQEKAFFTVLFYESFRFQSLETPLERQIRVESHNLPVFLPKIPELPYWYNHISAVTSGNFFPFSFFLPHNPHFQIIAPMLMDCLHCRLCHSRKCPHRFFDPEDDTFLPFMLQISSSRPSK